VLGAERPGVIERAVAADRDDWQTKPRRHRDRLEGIEPAHAGAPDEDAGPHGARVLHDLELAVFAIGDDVLDVHLAVRDELRGGLHHAVVRADRVRGHDVDVSKADRLGDRLTAAHELLGLDVLVLALLDLDSH